MMMNATNLSGFDDMSSDLDFGPARKATDVEDHIERVGRALGAAAAAPSVQAYVQPCKRCGGSGKYRAPSSFGTNCFLCGGSGTQSFKTSPEQREKARAQAAARKERKAQEVVHHWARQNPEDYEWLMSKHTTFSFAGDMLAKIHKWGNLTSSQHATVTRLRLADAERAAARAAAEAAKPPVQKLDALHSVLQRHSKFHAGDVTITRRNGDQLCWIKHKDAEKVVGKIDGGVLTLWNRPGVDTTAVRSMLEEFEGAPLQTAMKYGKLAGICCSCGRELTDDASIEAGIGPICAKKFN